VRTKNTEQEGTIHESPLKRKAQHTTEYTREEGTTKNQKKERPILETTKKHPSSP
jgi:hypothetical protein